MVGILKNRFIIVYTKKWIIKNRFIKEACITENLFKKCFIRTRIQKINDY